MKGSDPAFHTIFITRPENASDLRAGHFMEYRVPGSPYTPDHTAPEPFGRKIDAAVAASGLIKRSAKLASQDAS